MTNLNIDTKCTEFKTKVLFLEKFSRNKDKLIELKKKMINLMGKWNEEEICKIIYEIYDIGFRDSL